MCEAPCSFFSSRTSLAEPVSWPECLEFSFCMFSPEGHRYYHTSPNLTPTVQKRHRESVERKKQNNGLNTILSSTQYRVESMMLRVAKPLNYIPVTPSVQQRAHQRAPQCLPLVMEPESRFYSNSVVVLDFQSLYPSIIIAYNYCFSTCLGHVDSLGT